MAKDSKKNFAPEITNRKARYEYEFLETFTAGIVLSGTEVKSAREGKVNLTDAFCVFFGSELEVVAMQISQYVEGTYNNHEPKRNRKLLLTKKELAKLRLAVQDKGLTIVPYRFYFTERGFAKLDIALAKGKKTYDKRESIKERDVKRDMERE